MIEVLILSLIQGVTEFLPISSSSHLILFSKLTNFQNQSLSLDVSLHIGSFLAVITFFYKDLIEFVKNKDLFIKILISSSIMALLLFYILNNYSSYLEYTYSLKSVYLLIIVGFAGTVYLLSCYLFGLLKIIKLFSFFV